MLAEATLGVPALMVQRAGKLLSHGAPVGRLRPAQSGVARVGRDNALPRSAFFAAETVVMLGVIGRIGQRSIEGEEGRRLAHCRGEVGQVLAGSDARNRAEDQGQMGVGERGGSTQARLTSRSPRRRASLSRAWLSIPVTSCIACSCRGRITSLAGCVSRRWRRSRNTQSSPMISSSAPAPRSCAPSSHAGCSPTSSSARPMPTFGIVAHAAYDRVQDAGLRLVDARHLFPPLPSISACAATSA